MTSLSRLSSHSTRFQVELSDSQEGESWLLVYLDVITLLLVMFVVLLAFAGATGSRTTELSTLPAVTADDTGVSAMADKGGPELLTAAPEAPVQGVHENPLAGLDISELGDDIDVIVSEGGISFRISSEILFGSGQADVSQRGFDELQKLVPIFESSDLRITVTGHTDTVPIRTDRFPSNWELSSARAGSVVRYLEARGVDSSRLRAIGYASAEPIADNSTEAGRARNRRVELILESGL